MQLDNFLAHGQPQSRPQSGGLGRKKRIEKLRQILRRDAAPGVLDLRQHHVVAVENLVAGTRAFAVLAALELRLARPQRQRAAAFHRVDGVHQQVHEDLLNLVFLDGHARQVGRELRHEFDLLLVQFVPQQHERAFQHAVQILRLHVELMRRGKIQQPPRHLVGALDGVTHLREHQRHVLIGGGRALGQVLHAHLQNGQRVLHLVRHAGGERADGFHLRRLDQLQLRRLQIAMRLPQIEMRLPQIFLRADALGDVPKNSLDADDLPLRIVNGRLDDVHIPLHAARRLVHLHRLEDAPRLQHMQVIRLIFRREIGMIKIEVRLAHDLVERLAEKLAELLVREGEPLLQILPQDVLRQRFAERMIKRLGLRQALLRRLARRDVAHQRVVGDHFAVVIQTRHHGVPHPAQLAVLVQQPVLQRARTLAPHHAHGLLGKRAPVFGMHHLEPRFRRGGNFLRPPARQRFAGRQVNRLVRNAVLQIHRVSVIRDHIEQQPRAPLALLQGSFALLTFDGVLNRAPQPRRVEAPFHQIILRALAHRVQRQFLIIRPADHDDGRVAGEMLQAVESGQPLAVRQREIGDDGVKFFLEQQRLAFAQAFRADDFVIAVAMPQHLREQAGIHRVVFDDQDALVPLGHARVFAARAQVSISNIGLASGDAADGSWNWGAHAPRVFRPAPSRPE